MTSRNSGRLAESRNLNLPKQPGTKAWRPPGLVNEPAGIPATWHLGLDDTQKLHRQEEFGLAVPLDAA